MYSSCSQADCFPRINSDRGLGLPGTCGAFRRCHVHLYILFLHLIVLHVHKLKSAHCFPAMQLYYSSRSRNVFQCGDLKHTINLPRTYLFNLHVIGNHKSNRHLREMGEVQMHVADSPWYIRVRETLWYDTILNRSTPYTYIFPEDTKLHFFAFRFCS